jgi:hypothetical protein
VMILVDGLIVHWVAVSVAVTLLIKLIRSSRIRADIPMVVKWVVRPIAAPPVQHLAAMQSGCLFCNVGLRLMLAWQSGPHHVRATSI